MSYTQIASLVGALLAILVGVAGITFQWFATADGLGLIFTGLSILGVHAGGSIAGSMKQ